jgi:predicted RND superfamily exporter protein
VSEHRGMASMGLLLTIAVGFILLCTLVVLPAVLTWTGQDQAPATAAKSGRAPR